MKYDGWLARVVVMFRNRIHGVVGRRAELVNTGDRAVTDGTTVMPGHGGASGNRLECGCFLGSHGRLLRRATFQRSR